MKRKHSAKPPRVYLAGPEVFLPRVEALRLAEEKKAICAAAGLEGVFPFDLEAKQSGGAPAALAEAIAAKDEHLVQSCDAVIANLTPFRSPSADVGTVYELGFARGLSKEIFGYTNESRPYEQRVPSRADGRDLGGLFIERHGCIDNLMIHGALAASGDRLGAVISTSADTAISSLEAFRVAVKRAADHLLGRDTAVRPLTEDARASVEYDIEVGWMREALSEAYAAAI